MKIKNLKITKKLVSLLLTSSIALSSLVGAGVVKANNTNKIVESDNSINNSYVMEETSERPSVSLSEDYDFVLKKDNISMVYDRSQDLKSNIDSSLGYIITTANLNFRKGPDTTYKAMTVLKKGTQAEVIEVTDNNWYKIRVNGTEGYVSGDFVTFYANSLTDPIPSNEEKSETTYLYTTTNLNFREGPSTKYNRITLLRTDTKLELLEHLDNNWYKVRYNGQIGYVSGDYVSFNSSKSYRKDIKQVVYATTTLNLREKATTDSQSLYKLSPYETCEVLETIGDWYKVRCADQIGYVNKSYTKSLKDKFVVVDISEQKLTLYNNNEIILETDIVSGKKGTHDTPTGMYSVQSKTTDTYLTGADYRTHVDYWMPFYYGYGLHDADWRYNFGGTIYETNGSHGCVNIPPQYADDVYENLSIGSKVLVHK